MLSLVIQAGGLSRRMGQDKALVSFLGRPLIQRVIDRVGGLGDELAIISNRPEALRFLNLPIHADIIPERGALGGLYTALAIAQYPLVSVIACDMPFASPDLLSEERRLLEISGADAVIPKTEHGTEPFHAVYRREPCLSLVKAALDTGKWRVDSWFGEANLLFLSPEEMSRFDPHQLAFRNVNTPEELRQAEQLAIEESRAQNERGKLI
jgi:molybdopterin-guanine dinucleotide biosynthesis protein A